MGWVPTTTYIDLTPTITAGAYSANDAVGGKLTFSIATKAVGTGVIQSVVVIDEGKQSAELDLVLFDSDFTATADNAALNISDADAVKCIGTITVSSYEDIGGSTVGTTANVGIAFKAKDDRTLYGQLVTRGTPTYVATNDLTIRLAILAD